MRSLRRSTRGSGWLERFPAGALLLAGAVLLLAAPGSAVVIDTGDGTGNTTPPPDDPGFANVGRSSNLLSGVYVGNRWVLTADHVGEVDFSFGGVPYTHVPGSQVQLETSPGIGADLALVRLSAAPPLPTVTIATVSAALTDEVILIGNGTTRGPALTCWNGSWSEVSCGMGPPPAYKGYKPYSQRVVRWGQNEITLVNDLVNLAGRTSWAFRTDFDESGGLTHEAQVVGGDSGGAAFLKRGSQWELVGILFAQGAFGGQPADAAVFGNESYGVDVAFYADQIDAIVNPPVVVPALPLAALALGAATLLAVGRRALRV